MATDNKTYLTAAELSHRWGGKVAVGTLSNWRNLKKGPKYSKLGGKVLYAIDDVIAYEQQSVVKNTKKGAGNGTK